MQFSTNNVWQCHRRRKVIKKWAGIVEPCVLSENRGVRIDHGARIEAHSAESVVGMGRGYSPLPSQLGGLRERREFAQPGAPAENDFGAF